MLCRLSVENYALIDSLELELDKHLNIITGETGAGKSILLGALSLLLGAKNDGTAMKDSTRNCTVEGTFDIGSLGLEPLFEAEEMEYAPQTTITRIITPAGKSRAFVNDVPVSLAQMRELASRLIDIHSQHRNAIISSEAFRTEALDTVAGNGELLQKYGTVYQRVNELRRELAAMREEAVAARRDEEWLRFQCEELTAANLRAGELAETEAELTVLENADRIRDLFTELRNALDEDETGILARLKSAQSGMQHLVEHYPAAGDYSARLRSVLEELKDLGSSVAADTDRLDADPERLAKLSARVDLLYSLQQKHRVLNEAELIAARDGYIAKLQTITNGDAAIAAAEKSLAKAEQEAHSLAEKLHKARERVAKAFAAHVVETLGRLGMADTHFVVELQPTPELTRTGADSVQFMFTANKSMPAQAVERIASGGELSRVMLALKSLLAEKMQLPTVVFDEIDTGVSGRIADAMGEIIAELSARMQVIDITHLPQVASKGAAHFVVYKRDGRTSLSRLTDEEREVEIAKMLSGSDITDAALTQARILLGRPAKKGKTAARSDAPSLF